MSNHKLPLHVANGASFPDVLTMGARPKQDSLYIYKSESDKSAKVPFRQMTIYVCMAIFIWLIIAACICTSSFHKQKDISEHSASSADACCNCSMPVNISFVKVEWSQCAGPKHGHTCDLTTYDWNKIKKEDSLSTTSFGYFHKDYRLYGGMAVLVSVCQIIVIVLCLSLIKDASAGVSILIHTIVSLEICFYFVFKIYQYYPVPVAMDQWTCYADVLSKHEEQWTDVTILAFIGIHVFLQVASTVFATCCRNVTMGISTTSIRRTKCRHYWHTITSIVWVVCILSAFAIYTLITYRIAVVSMKLDRHHQVLLIVIVVAIFVQMFLIFAFPFCFEYTKLVCQSWKCYFLCPGNRSTAALSSSDKIITPFHELIDVELDRQRL